MVLNPALRYNSMVRTDTRAVMEEEARFYDLIFESDGAGEAVFDIVIGTNPDTDAPILLKCNLIRGKPRAFSRSRTEGQPGVSEPPTTLDIFGAPRSMNPYIEKMGGRSMRFGGILYTIMYTKPHGANDVVTFIELHCSQNEGLHIPKAIADIF